MRIAIDCRKIADFGIGTYIRGLLTGLATIDSDDEYVLFAPLSAAENIPDDTRFRLVQENSPHYSLRELTALGRRTAEVKADLFHAPHYVVPVTRCPIIVTIHDLIHLHQPLNKSVMKPAARVYAHWMLGRATRLSRRILTVSETVAGEIAARWPDVRSKVRVTPNGIDDAFREPVSQQEIEALRKKLGVDGPYVLFAGNEKPHKNLATLMAALRVVRAQQGLTLVLAGGAFPAYRGEEGVIVPGFLPQRELAVLIAGAIALVQPSLEEGFGLPAAEAMAAGTAVITSTAPALVEVTGDAALHVEARDVTALADAMRKLTADPALRVSLIDRGRLRATTLTWRRCAEETLLAYHEAAKSPSS